MKHLFIFVFIYLCFYISLYAQKHDNIWLFGYNTNVPNAPGYGGSVIDFSLTPPDIYHEYREMDFNFTNGSICDTTGEVLFYSNGIYISNALGQPMVNGLGINPGDYANNNPGGYILAQGVLALPHPDSSHLFFLIHANFEYPQENLSFYTSKIYYSKVDMRLENGLGAVVEKNVIVIEDVLEPGKITTCRHANGRDWWLLIRRYDSNEYYTFLINSTGFQNKGIQIIGDSIPSPGLGQAVFSPDGTKFASLHLVSGFPDIDEDYIDIYDFDRCTGLLSNHQQITYLDNASSGGVAISPNSRFLYVSSFINIYQYDLWAEDIEASKDTVAIWDGFMVPPVFATTFFLAQLAPDGKIYISANNAVQYLHVINNPNLPGELCDVCQHCVLLPTYNAFSMPNFPNYRLNALESSPCDTLRQPPTAAWSYEAHDPEVAFQDSSYHDIRSWHWDFGDGVTDTVPHPVHTYVAEGVYNVCLAVSNPRGADTLCREVVIIANNSSEVIGGVSVRISPNPVSGNVPVNLSADLPIGAHEFSDMSFVLRDALGREILRIPVHVSLGRVQKELNLALLPVGVYFCSLETKERKIWQDKLIKS